MARAVARSPALNAGWPQQVWPGTPTVQPASSSSLAAANPIDGRIRSTRQVTKRATRRVGSAMEAFSKTCDTLGDIGRKGVVLQATAADRRNVLARFWGYRRRMAIIRWFLISGVCGYALIVGLLYVMQRSLLYHPTATRISPAKAGMPEAEEVVLPTSDGEKLV